MILILQRINFQLFFKICGVVGLQCPLCDLRDFSVKGVGLQLVLNPGLLSDIAKVRCRLVVLQRCLKVFSLGIIPIKHFQKFSFVTDILP